MDLPELGMPEIITDIALLVWACIQWVLSKPWIWVTLLVLILWLIIQGIKNYDGRDRDRR